jgi:hypothetical protein
MAIGSLNSIGYSYPGGLMGALGYANAGNVAQQQAIGGMIEWANVAYGTSTRSFTITPNFTLNTTIKRASRAIERLRDEITEWHGDALGRRN